MDMRPKNQMISVTDLTTYLYCPRLLYLKKVKKIPTPATKEMIAGRLKHQILEEFSNSEENLIRSLDRVYENIDLVLLYDNLVKSIAERIFFENKKIIIAFRINEEELLRKVKRDFSEDIRLRIISIAEKLKLGLFKEELLNSLDKVYISELKLESLELGLKGRVERIEIDRSKNKITPYEIKNRSEKIFYSDEIQLTAYAMLLENFYKTKVNSGVIESGTNKKEIIIQEEDRQSVLNLIEEVRLIESSVPEMLSNFSKCKSCSLNEICPNF